MTTQQTKSFFLSLRYFLVFSVVGIIVGFAIGNLITILNNAGLSTSWKQLDSSLKFAEIVDVTSQVAWAKATDGKLYFWDSNCYRNLNGCNQWIETIEIPSDIHRVPEQPMIRSDSCPTRDFSLLRKLPGNLVECAQGEFLGFDSGTIAYYALLDNGTIWTWRFNSSTIADMFLTILFSLAGLVFSNIAFIVLMIWRKRKTKTQATAESIS